MLVKDLHIWDVKPREAIHIQKLLATEVILEGEVKNIKYVAGCDISFDKNSTIGYAVIVVLSYPKLEVVEVSNHIGHSLMPYIPGLLSFREGPLILDAFRKLKTTPDIVVYDGQGYAHPRKIGLASHMGLITKIPSIGCAKSLFVGKFEPKKSIKGDFSPLIYNDETIGYVLYTKNNCNPVYVSVGHKVSLDFAKDFILSCIKNYKLPEPTRQAHNYSNELRKQNKDKLLNI